MLSIIQTVFSSSVISEACLLFLWEHDEECQNGCIFCQPTQSDNMVNIFMPLKFEMGFT